METVTERQEKPPAVLPPDESETKTNQAGRRRPWGVLALIVLGAVGAWFYGRHLETAKPNRPPTTAAVPVVVAATISRGDIDVTLDALGTVTSLATVTVVSQISGQLVHVAYTEGQVVKKGDLLAEIDSRPYQLALAQAQGALERDQALLQNAELDLKRYQDLAKTNSIPRQQLDTQVSLVLQDKGNVVSDQAQIETQQLNISYCHIVAPVDGRVGLRLVDQGNYVTPSQTTGLVVITQLKPITVIFPVAEDYLPEIVKRLRAGATLPVTAFDRSGSIKLSEGELKSLDSEINTTTGTLNLRAEFANEDENLFPNQFVNARLRIDVLHNVLIAPTSAIQRGAPGTFVYLVRPDQTVVIQPVTLGPTSGDRVAIQSGISAGDKVVTDGADRLRNGTKVTLVAEPAANGNAPPAANGQSHAPSPDTGGNL
ncbi:MdtA/MuxA family multidrug efflux RND transporter periplasmic adaptor subunit [Bradyrhizobium sp.]|uniref:MdtA/MuxA family multidrug efflux RND transporter periplasmic adaptor subunit n=1 Tax=Bradyrhizobium sp. TaxID=376 RepID=UPI003C6B9DB8